MKFKSILIVLLTMLVTLISCDVSSNQIEHSNGYAYASFGNTESKGLSQSYSGYQAYNQLYWYYSAEKADTYGLTGQTKTVIDNVDTVVLVKVPGIDGKGLAGKIGPFSEGKWNINLYATSEALTPSGSYSEKHDGADVSITYYTIPVSDVVYSGTIEEIMLRRNQTNYIPVTVSPAGVTGKIMLADNLHYSYQNGAGAGALYLAASGTCRLTGSSSDTDVTFESKELVASGTDYYLATDSYLKTAVNADIPSGIYSVKFSVVTEGADALELQSQTLSFKVFGGLTTLISGDLIEGLSYENYFTVEEQDIRIFEALPVGNVLEVNAVPKANSLSDEKTVVSFPAGSLDSVFNIQHTLEVRAIPQVLAGDMFSVSSEEETAVAGLKLVLTQIVTSSVDNKTSTAEKKVSTFNNQYVLVKTYVEKDLTDVNVKYNGTDAEQPVYAKTGSYITEFANEAMLESSSDKTGYVPSTGLLVFRTNHFSEFYITAGVDAVIVETNRAYTNLDKAFSAVNDGQTIKLVQNVTRNVGLQFNRNVSATLDLNGKTLKVTGSVPAVDGGRAIKITDGILTIKNGTVDGRDYLPNGEVNDTPTFGGPWSSTRTGGAVRISGGDCILENLKLYNNDGWGNAIKLESDNSLVMRNCDVYSVYGSGLEVGQGIADIYSSSFTQTKLAQKPYMSCCIAVCDMGTVNIHNAMVNLTLPQAQMNAEGVYALYIYDSGGIINVDGGSFNSNAKHVIHVDGASLGSFLYENMETLSDSALTAFLKENKAYLDYDALVAKSSTLTAPQKAEFDSYRAIFDAYVVAHGGKTSVMTISGGTFNGDIFVTSNGVSAPYAQLAIKGGTYSVDPTAWVISGCQVSKTGTTWTVSEQN